MKTTCETREKARKNIARMLGVGDYSTLICATQHESDRIVAEAKSLRKRKAHPAPVALSSGNPYVMLNRFMNRKGKAIK